MVLLDDGQVVGSACAEVGAVVVLGVQSVTGQHGVLEVDGVQQGLEGGDFVAFGGDLSLGQNHAVVVHRDQQLDRGGGSRAGAADRFAVDRDRAQRRLRRHVARMRRWRSGLEVRSDGRVQCVALDALEQAPDRGRVRRRPDAGERVGREAEPPPRLLVPRASSPAPLD